MKQSDHRDVSTKTLYGLPSGHPAHLVIGLTVWSVWFVAVYGGLSVACALVSDPALNAFNPVNLTLALITLLTAGGLAWGAKVCWQNAPSGARGKGRGSDQNSAREYDQKAGQAWFVTRISAGLYLLSAGATLFVGFPLLALPPCV